jgi:hypothetical protein
MTWDILLAHYISNMTLTNLIICSGYLMNALIWALYVVRFKNIFNPQSNVTLLIFGSSITIVFILMGLNRLFNLEIWLGNVCREISKVQGWYDQRHTVQILFIAGILVTGLGVLVLMEISIPRLSRHNWPILCGLIGLVGLVAIDAASFHNLDQFFNMLIGGEKIRSIMEFAGIAFITISLIINFKRIGKGIPVPETVSATKYI